MSTNTITVPLGEVAGQIRESIRSVITSHHFVVCTDRGDRFACLPSARFEQLLVELGNNAAMALVAAAYEHESKPMTRGTSALDVRCPSCDAERDAMCSRGGTRVPFHGERIRLAAETTRLANASAHGATIAHAAGAAERTEQIAAWLAANNYDALAKALRSGAWRQL